MNFFKNVLSTIVGLILFSFIGFFFTIIIFGVIGVSSNKKSNKTVSNNSVLKLDLKNIDKDYGGSVYIEEFDYREKNNLDFFHVLKAIDHAKTNTKIKGISIENNNSSIGIAQRQALRKRLEEFKKTGKFILSYANNYSQGEYYLCSVSDTIFINPVGSLDFKGLSTELIYMKNLQNFTGIEMQVIRHGKYKSAVEPFLQQEMSNENKEQNTELLFSVWNALVSDISNSRKIPIDKLNEIAKNQDARTPELALKNNFVDKIAYLDEYNNSLKNALNISKNDKINEISIEDYIENNNLKNSTAKDNEIAVIFAQGEIRNGEGNTEHIGEISINRALEKARNNKNIKAVVLRVDSPGGDALTSELIWREIELTKKIKPVIVSMGNTAASGGYYISCNANKIFAEPTTVTGSIGVFGMIPNAENLAKRIGISSYEITTHNNSDISILRPLSEKNKNIITENIEFIYNTFLERVAKGRKLSKEQVHQIAQGRIWTGIMAKENGLVDEIGGIDDAINYAAKISGIKDFKITTHPTYKIDFADFLSSIFKVSSNEIIKQSIINEIGLENYKTMQQINYLKTSDQIQAILPYKIHIN